MMEDVSAKIKEASGNQEEYTNTGAVVKGQPGAEDKSDNYKDSRTILKRPKSLPADILRFKNREQDWIAFIGLSDGKPYEIFTGVADYELFPIPDSISKGCIIKTKDEQGNKRYDFEYIDRLGYKKTIGGLSHMFNPEYWNYAKLISGVLRHGMPLHDVVELVSTLKLDSDFINNWANGVKRALSPYIKDNTKVKGKCEKCGSANMAFQEGCPTCQDCGYGQC